MSRFGRLINAGFGRCKHRVLGTCVDAADGCCAGVACAICVKLLDADGEVVDAVSLAWNGTGYSGSVGGFSFESYWLDNYGDCEFHVIISAGGYIEPIHIIKTKGDYTDAACCMNPSGEASVDDGDNTYTMTWGPVDPLILARRPVITSECAQIDIAIVVDDTSSMASVISSLQTEIGNLVTAVDAVSDSFQFSLITFKDTTTQTVSFSLNNAAAINAAVAAMTTGMGNQIPEASDIALNEAVVQSGWRSAARKVIVLITDAPPGGLDDVADPADVINLNAGGTAAGVADQYMYCVGVGTNAAMISAMTSTAAAAVAAGGGGKYETLTPGNIVTNVIALVDTLCPPVTCYERYCGDCDCAPRQLCLQVCGVAKIISLAENPADPDCPLPVWDLDFTCGYFSFAGQVALVRDEYTGGCILRMSGTRDGGYDEESQDYAVTDCAELSAEFTLTEGYDDYLITISPADCGICESICDCCQSSATDAMRAPFKGTLLVTKDLGTYCPSPPPEAPFISHLTMVQCLRSGHILGTDTHGVSIECALQEDGSHAFVAVSKLGLGPGPDTPPVAAIIAATPGAMMAAPYDQYWRFESVEITCPQCPDIPGYASLYSGINYQYCPPQSGPGGLPGGNFGLYFDGPIDQYENSGC